MGQGSGLTLSVQCFQFVRRGDGSSRAAFAARFHLVEGGPRGRHGPSEGGPTPVLDPGPRSALGTSCPRARRGASVVPARADGPPAQGRQPLAHPPDGSGGPRRRGVVYRWGVVTNHTSPRRGVFRPRRVLGCHHPPTRLPRRAGSTSRRSPGRRTLRLTPGPARSFPCAPGGRGSCHPPGTRPSPPSHRPANVRAAPSHVPGWTGLRPGPRDGDALKASRKWEVCSLPGGLRFGRYTIRTSRCSPTRRASWPSAVSSLTVCMRGLLHGRLNPAPLLAAGVYKA